MGNVYEALDLKLNREVTLKVFPPEIVSDAKSVSEEDPGNGDADFSVAENTRKKWRGRSPQPRMLRLTPTFHPDLATP